MVKKHTIGIPFTPSTIISREVFVAKEIHMSCGGGMGGSTWYEYTLDDFNLDDRFIEIWTNESGQTKSKINTAYIVGVRDVLIARIKVRNDGNDHIDTVGIRIGEVGDYCYVFDNDGTEVEFGNRYSFNEYDHKYDMRGNSNFLDKED